MKVTWELRYRSPIAPTKGVDTVEIQTNSNDVSRAKVVAEYWLGKERPHPSTKFVYVRPAIVQTEDDMENELATLAGKKPPQAAAEPGKATNGRIGA